MYLSSNNIGGLLSESGKETSEESEEGDLDRLKHRLKKTGSVTEGGPKNTPEFADFDAEEDLQTPEVIALLQEEVKKTHQRIRRDSIQLQQSFRRKINGESKI